MGKIFSDFVRDKLRDGFIGRADLFTAVKSFIKAPASHLSAGTTGSGGPVSQRIERVLLITGEPGIGKSTVMCRIIGSARGIKATAFTEPVSFPRRLLLGYFKLNISVLAVIESYYSIESLIVSIRDRMMGHHICMASNAVTLSPIRFVRSLALQFCSNMNEFDTRWVNPVPHLSC